MQSNISISNLVDALKALYEIFMNPALDRDQNEIEMEIDIDTKDICKVIIKVLGQVSIV